jgi:hypothetical protein
MDIPSGGLTRDEQRLLRELFENGIFYPRSPFPQAAREALLIIARKAEELAALPLPDWCK